MARMDLQKLVDNERGGRHTIIDLQLSIFAFQLGQKNENHCLSMVAMVVGPTTSQWLKMLSRLLGFLHK